MEISKDSEYEDQEFENIDFFNEKKLSWIRMSTVIKSPVLFRKALNGKPSFGRIIQGEISDCFLITSLTVLCSRPSLLEKLFLIKEVTKQGVYSFQFYNSFHNSWKNIIIDESIPFKGNGKPSFAKCVEDNLIWASLIEKAYAKFCGGYVTICGGNVSETIYDLSSYPVVDINLTKKENLKNLWGKLSTWRKKQFLLSCANVTKSKYDYSESSITNNHAYAITKVHITAKTKKKFIEVTNPLGGKNCSFLRKKYSFTGKKFMEKNEGRTWMSYEQFKTKFNRLYCCMTLNEQYKQHFFANEKWNYKGLDNIRKCNQFHLRITSKKKQSKVIITISQKSKRHEKDKTHKLNYDEVGFYIINAKKTNPLILTTDNYKIIHKTSFWNKRDVSREVLLDSNKDYFIIPMNNNKKSTSEVFSIRVDCIDTVEVNRCPLVSECNLKEKIVFKGKFHSKGGKSNLRQSRSILLYSHEDAQTIWIFLKQMTSKKPTGVGIFVLENFSHVPDSLSNNAIAQVGFSNPKELSLKVNLKKKGVFLIVFPTWKTGMKGEFEASIIGDYNVMSVFSNEDEMMNSEHKDVCNNFLSSKRSKNTPKKKKERRKVNVRKRGRGRGRGRMRGRSNRSRGRNEKKSSRSGVMSNSNNTSSVIANLYSNLE